MVHASRVPDTSATRVSDFVSDPTLEGSASLRLTTNQVTILVDVFTSQVYQPGL